MIEIVEPTKSKDNGLAYFCPHCNQLIEVKLDIDDSPLDISKNREWRCYIDTCTNKIYDDSPFIIVWKED